ncbi:MAG: hypothetical protein ABW051_03660 [Burkholderiaceae bacterium]
MKTRLRHIAVHAEEPHAGRFVWVLTEQMDTSAWNEIQRADSACATYKESMAEGLRALQALAGDLDTGPRTRRAEATAARDGEADASADDAPGKDAPPKKSLFGFGPAR